MGSRYPSLVNRGQVLLQHDNARPHTSKRTKKEIEELEGYKIRSPDLAPSDYHIFRSMAHFLVGRKFNNEEEIKWAVVNFLPLKMRIGIIMA